MPHTTNYSLKSCPIFLSRFGILRLLDLDVFMVTVSSFSRLRLKSDRARQEQLARERLLARRNLRDKKLAEKQQQDEEPLQDTNDVMVLQVRLSEGGDCYY